MQFNIYINQKAFVEYHPHLDLKDAAIFDFLYHFYPHAYKQQDNAYISYRLIIDNLPLIKINNKTVIARRMKKLRMNKLIDYYYDKEESRVYYRLESIEHLFEKDTITARTASQKTTEKVSPKNQLKSMRDSTQKSARLDLEVIEEATEKSSNNNTKDYLTKEVTYHKGNHKQNKKVFTQEEMIAIYEKMSYLTGLDTVEIDNRVDVEDGSWLWVCVKELNERRGFIVYPAQHNRVRNMKQEKKLWDYIQHNYQNNSQHSYQDSIQHSYQDNSQSINAHPLDVLESALKDEFWSTKSYHAKSYNHLLSTYYRSSNDIRRKDTRRGGYLKGKESRNAFFDVDALLDN